MRAASQLETATRALPTGPAGLIFDIMRYALHDGPGIRTTVFFKGCPLSCWWCHNPESQSLYPELMYFPERCLRCDTCEVLCPQHAVTRVGDAMITSDACRVCGTCANACSAEAREVLGKWMSVEEVLAEVEKDVIFFDESGGGVTLSGGEPLLQPDFAEALLRGCRERGIHTALDTCGLAAIDALQRVARYVDLFLFDLKLLDAARHRQYAGADNGTILRNLEALATSGCNTVVRFPVIPGINDSSGDTAQMIAFLTRLGLRRIDLLGYHKIGADKYRRLKMEYRLDTVEPPNDTYLQDLALQFQREGFTVRIGG
jgi:pyruvate formate lyase activating enzyme